MSPVGHLGDQVGVTSKDWRKFGNQMADKGRNLLVLHECLRKFWSECGALNSGLSTHESKVQAHVTGFSVLGNPHNCDPPKDRGQRSVRFRQAGLFRSIGTWIRTRLP